MKKVLIIFIMLFIFTLTACSKNYEEMYGVGKDIKIVKEFSEEERNEYLEKCKKKLNTMEYITYEGRIITKDRSLLVPGAEKYSYESNRVGKYQKNADIKFVYEEYWKKVTIEETKIVNWKFYGTNSNIYYDYNSGEKVYTDASYSKDGILEYFIRETYLWTLEFNDNQNCKFGKDKNGNVIAYMQREDSAERTTEIIYVYNDYKLFYAEERVIINNELIDSRIEIFSYNDFEEITKDFSGYEYSIKW